MCRPANSCWPCSGLSSNTWQASDLSPKTIQKHVDNMWALGGEFIRDLHSDSSLRKKPVELVLRQMIEYGGPLLYHGGEDQQRSFDSTCRKFHNSLTRRLAEARCHPQIPPRRRREEMACQVDQHRYKADEDQRGCKDDGHFD